MTAAPGLDEQAHVDALTDLLTGPLNGHVYSHGKVPGADGNDGDLPDIYVVLTLERRYAGDAPRKAGYVSRSGWRVLVRGVGRTVKEARWALVQATSALEDVHLVIDETRSTPITHESSTPIAPDDGRQSGLVEWTYAL